MGGFGTVAVLLLAGWSFLEPALAWAYLAAALAFEVWLSWKIATVGRHPASAGEPPYHFSAEEAQLVGRFRIWFTDQKFARGLASILSALGLTALVLAPWLAYKHAFVPSAGVALNVLLLTLLTRRLIPVGDTQAIWEKIHAGNA
jgi:hypothetical protein